jgi:hypothetical protein
MTKEEIQEKIRRIAQKAAMGHDTSSMGIGLRDLGYAVAKSREESEQSQPNQQKKLNVKTIAKHAEEIYRSAASNASESGVSVNGGNGNRMTFGRRESSSAASTASVSGNKANQSRINSTNKMHPQQARAISAFDPIGEVSEGAYSIEDSASFANRKPSVFTQQQQQQQQRQMGGANGKFKSKADRFFGSIRIQQQNLMEKEKRENLKRRIKDLIERAKVMGAKFVAKVSEKVSDMTYEWKARIRAERIKLNGGRAPSSRQSQNSKNNNHYYEEH